MADYSDLGFTPTQAPSNPHEDLGFQPTPQEAPGALEAFGRSAINVAGLEPVVAGGAMATGNVVSNILNGKLSLQDAIDQYKKTRDSENAANQAAEKEHPVASAAGGIAGGIGLAALTGGLGALPEVFEGTGIGAKLGNAALTGATYGGATGIGNSVSAGQGLEDTAKNGLGGAVVGGLIGPAVEAGLYGLGKSGVGNALQKFGEAQAVKAGGATGAQARLFDPDTGRMLLDNKVVGLGDSQANIANKADALLNQTGQSIGDLVKQLTQKGAGYSKQDILNELEDRMTQLSDNSSQLPVVRQLQSIGNDIVTGPDDIGLDLGEKTKTGFQNQTNYNDPTDLTAKGVAANVYKTAGETAANNTDPELAQQFIDQKKLYGQLSPFAEAADKRASTIAQSPTGGLGDMAAYGVAGIPGVVIKKGIISRVNSTLAVTADKLGASINKLATVPVNSIEGAISGGSNVAADAAKKVSTAIQPLTDNAFGNAAKQLVNSGSAIGMKLGSELAKGIGKDSSQKNAILFSLMQQPGYREELQKHFTDQSDNQQ